MKYNKIIAGLIIISAGFSTTSYCMSDVQLQSEYRKLNNQVQYLISESQKESFSNLKDSIASLRGELQDNQYQLQKIKSQYDAKIRGLQSDILRLDAQQKKEGSLIIGSSMDAKSEKLFKGGLLFLKDKNYSKASEIFRRYQANYPVGAHASESMYLRGQIALALGKPQVAESRFKELLRVYPKSKKAPDTYLNLALIAKAMGKKKELNNYIKIINKRYPKSSAYKKSLQLKT